MGGQEQRIGGVHKSFGHRDAVRGSQNKHSWIQRYRGSVQAGSSLLPDVPASEN